jgi:hypothetical protein
MKKNQNEKGCRFCGEKNLQTFCDLGKTPLSNAYLYPQDLGKEEIFYPLHALLCPSCLLVQLQEFQTPQEIFKDYAYFSSYSSSWLKHCQEYVNKMVKRFSLTSSHFVMELASNDGYLLQFFKEFHIPTLGIEPAENVAKMAQKSGIPTIAKFFGTQLAKELKKEKKCPDLLIGNNVLAHVPDLNDFVQGMKILLNKEGVVTMEFPHLLQLMQNVQFDTIYHEHFSYFSFLTVEKIFAAHGLSLFDVEELPTHGGSIRIYAKHLEDLSKEILPSVSHLKEKEISFGLDVNKSYLSFSQKVETVKEDLMSFLMECKKNRKKVAGYGAPAKGNTLLNYCEVTPELLPFTVDISPHKQGRFLPGTHIPIMKPEDLQKEKPDYLLILPWNIKKEIMEQTSYLRSWGGKFVVAIPSLEVI